MSRHRLAAEPRHAATALRAPDPESARHRAPELPVPRPPARRTAPSEGRPAALSRATELARRIDDAATDSPSRHGSTGASPAPSSRHRRSDGGGEEATAVRSSGRHRGTAGGRTGSSEPAPERTAPVGARHTSRARRGGRRRGALVLVTVAASLLALPTVSSASADRCRWQRAAQSLFVALDGRHDDRANALRDALTAAGVGRDLPAECTPTGTPGATGSTTTTTASGPSSAPATTRPSPSPTTRPSPTRSTPAPTPTGTPSAATPATGTGSTAAAALGWGTPTKVDDFTAGLAQWGVYDGTGHDGNGRRTPSAVTVSNGILTITGDSAGNSGGMAWGDGRKYGRYEARVRSTAGDESYHPVMLLWPDAENWPVGGEVDWMEISSADRQDADTFLHFGASNDQVHGNVRVDATQWHNWAVEWSPRGVTTYLDGTRWWSTGNTSILPPGPMHMTIQLDYFGGGNPKTSQMQVDWVKQYGV